LFFMGTGWKFYKLEERVSVKEIKIHELKEGRNVFAKNIKLSPKCSGLIHEDLKEALLSFSFDSYLYIPLKMIIPDAKAGDSIYVEVEEEIVKGDAINYIFGLPIRVERIELERPVKFKQVKVKRTEG